VDRYGRGNVSHGGKQEGEGNTREISNGVKSGVSKGRERENKSLRKEKCLDGQHFALYVTEQGKTRDVREGKEYNLYCGW